MAKITEPDGATNVATSTAPTAYTRFEETAATLGPAPAWWGETTTAGVGVTLSGDRAVYAADAGATATFTFTGTGVSWRGLQCEVCGIARVSVDGAVISSVDTFSPTRSVAVIFTTSELPAGNHSLAIGVAGTRNTSSGGTFIVVDLFDVTP